MWIASSLGFFSIVLKKDGYHVRARIREDLEALRDAAGIKETIREWPGADYRFRLLLGRSGKAAVFRALCESVTYDNFKNKVADTPSQRNKLGIYSGLWHAMAGLQNRCISASTKTPSLRS